MTEFLPILWFILVAVLWTGYLVLEGFDFGVGMLLKILPKNAKERRVALSTIGPHWDGNEVWLLTAGGATFAAFPRWYATLFSGMYLALGVILIFLIVRICAIEWRGKISDPVWAERWDLAHTISAWGPAILWGVAFANLVQGMKIEFLNHKDGAKVAIDAVDAAARATGSYQLTGGFFSLLTPFTILGGLVTASIFLSHGAIFLSLKTVKDSDLHKRAADMAWKLAAIATVISAVWVLWAQLAYSRNALTWIPLVLAAVGLIGTTYFAYIRREGLAFLFNAVAVAMAVTFIFGSMAPYVMKSSYGEGYSLTIQDAAATTTTLTIMSVAALVFVPIVLGYTVWSYLVFKKRLSTDHLPENPAGIPMDDSHTREVHA